SGAFWFGDRTRLRAATRVPSLRAKRSNPEILQETGLLRRFAPRNDDEVAQPPSQEAYAALSGGHRKHGGYHEDDFWQACRDAFGVGADVRSCGSAKQDHDRGRGRRLPVLSADRAGKAA